MVAENFWGSIVAQLAGPDATVDSLITNPNTDPHDYEPTPSDARKIASARYVVENGIGYDTWVAKILDANPAQGRRVLDIGKLLDVPVGGNPHQWYSPTSVERVITRVTEDLGRLDPRHRAAFERRRADYEGTGLHTYNALLAQIRQRYEGTPIGASESIVTPLATALGLRLMTPESYLDAISEGSDPTAADKTTADTQITTNQIKVFVYNRQNATPDVQRLVDAARAHGIPVTTVSETLEPVSATFQAWQVGQLQALARALESATRR